MPGPGHLEGCRELRLPCDIVFGPGVDAVTGARARRASLGQGGAFHVHLYALGPRRSRPGPLSGRRLPAPEGRVLLPGRPGGVLVSCAAPA